MTDVKQKPLNADETLQRLVDSLDADILTDAMTDAEVEQELRDAGGDPAAIAARGHLLVAQLLERRRLEAHATTYDFQFQNHTVQESILLIGQETPSRAQLTRWLQELIDLREFRDAVSTAHRKLPW